MDYATMQSILGWAAIAAALIAGGIVGAMLVYDLGKPLWRRLARLWRRSPVECVAAVALLCYCVAWGGGKITFPRTNAEYELLKDAGSFILTAGETLTNQYYDVAFDYDMLAIRFTAHPILPDTADIQLWRRPAASTNDADWVAFDDKRTLAEYRDGDECALDITLAAHTATNWNWVVFTTWQPAPAVQTNGVLHVDWWGATNGAANAVFGIPLKSAVETTEGKQLAPVRNKQGE